MKRVAPHVGGEGNDSHDIEVESCTVKSSRSLSSNTSLADQQPEHISSKARVSKTVWLTGVFLFVLCLENCASMLARRYAVGVLHLKFGKSSVLFVNEVLKLLFCIFVIAHNKRQGSFARETSTLAHLTEVMRRSGPMAIPALVYLVVNLISYPSLERINASVFTAVSQLKVLATALFSVVILGTHVSGRKWRSLTMMVLGVTLVTWESAPEMAHVAHNQGEWSHLVSLDYLLGLSCAVIQTLLSGFGAIYFEKVLKQRTAGGHALEELSVWDRNVQLAVYSMLLYCPVAFYETGGNVMQGWCMLVWFIAGLHAAGGVLVALSVLYSNSITKTVAVCGSLVLTTFAEQVFFDAPLNGPILLGCAIVIMSIFGYRDDCQVEEQLRELRSSLTHIPK